MNWKLIIGIGVVIIVMAYAIGGLTWLSDQNIDDSSQESLTNLENTNWTLSQFYSIDSMQDLIEGSKITAQFKDGQIGGKAGCNNYFASYELGNDQSISISETGSTMMYCQPESLMAQETTYMSLLPQAVKYQATKESLKMYNSNGELILNYQVSASISLEDTSWQATGINNNQGDVGGVVTTATTNLTTAYLTDGKIEGFGGCNDYNGTYTLDGNQITFGPLSSTFKACEEDLMQQEQNYFVALEKTEVYQVKDNRLEFRNSAGSLQVSFQIAE